MKIESLFTVVLLGISAVCSGEAAHAQGVGRNETYCADGPLGPGISTCPRVRVLRIPSTYQISGRNEFAVAYPGMQPWSSIPWLDRSKFQKIEFSFQPSMPFEAGTILDGYAMSDRKPARQPDIHGQEQYLKEGWGTSQILVHRHNPSMFTLCAYSADPKNEAGYGCSSQAMVIDGLRVKYSYKRVLLPHSLAIHSEMEGLVRSFSVCLGLNC